MMVAIAFLMLALAYLYGCFSTARIVAKIARSLNVYKLGTGLADTENIFSNVSRPLGILVGALDAAKAYLFLLAVELAFTLLAGTGLVIHADKLHSPHLMMLYGMAMLIGHCLPVTHRFKGGRGIFTYSGFVAYLVFYPMLITLIIAWLLVFFFRQIRFAQYMIVLLPGIFAQIFYSFIPLFRRDLPAYFLAMMLGIAALMGILNFIVSKKMGELS
jgi:glycerol-3-phosphate acyltransferase PlsY